MMRTLKQAFGLPDALEDMVPIEIGPRIVEAILKGEEKADFSGRLAEAYARIAKGRDVIVLEGGCNLREGYLIELPIAQVADLLGAKEIVVVKYNSDLQVLDDALTVGEGMGKSFIGVVLNAVPRQRMPFAQEVIKPALEQGRVLYAS